MVKKAVEQVNRPDKSKRKSFMVDSVRGLSRSLMPNLKPSKKTLIVNDSGFLK